MTDDIDARIDALSKSLRDRQSPEQMQTTVDRLAELLGTRAMFNRGKTFREGWIAARFARRRGASTVWLLAEREDRPTPDFAVEVDGQELWFETTEADIPGRRRQDEYREPPRVEPMIFTSFDVMVEHVRTLCAQKAAKRYDRCDGLIIFLNPPIFSFEPGVRWAGLVRAGEPAAAAFSEVWIMRGAGAVVWKDGRPQAEVPGEEF